MCLATPAKITQKKGNCARVDFGAVEKNISIALTPSAKKGDYVLVHAGFAIQVLKEKDALKTLKIFKEIQ